MYQGRPFREGIRENPPLYYGLLGASAVAYAGATEFMPELNSWLQLVPMGMDVSTSWVLAIQTYLDQANSCSSK